MEFGIEKCVKISRKEGIRMQQANQVRTLNDSS